MSEIRDHSRWRTHWAANTLNLNLPVPVGVLINHLTVIDLDVAKEHLPA